MKPRILFYSVIFGLAISNAYGQFSRRGISFDVSPGYSAGLIQTDFLAFTRLRLDDISRFHESPVVILNHFSLEPRVRIQSNYVGLNISYISSSTSYPSSTFTTLGASGSTFPSTLRYVSSSYGAFNVSLSYGRRLRFKNAYIVPQVSLGIGFVSTMRVVYEGQNGDLFETNNTAAPSTLTRNPLTFRLSCYYESNNRNSGRGLKVNYKIGPYLGVISNAEFNQVFFLNGGISMQFPFSS